jgi:hypothetical protein
MRAKFKNNLYFIHTTATKASSIIFRKYKGFSFHKICDKLQEEIFVLALLLKC